MAKPSPDRKPVDRSPVADDEPEAALCEHELNARRENEMRAKRKRDIESND
jgi:hypothetical protein